MPTFKRADQEQIEKAKDLLEAGPQRELGFVRSLFYGRLKLEQVLPYPQLDADEAERVQELIKRLDAFLKAEVDPEAIDREERIPQQVIDGLARLGIFGLIVPEEYGGLGLSHTAYCRVLEHVSRHCASTAVLIGAHQSIGLKALLLMGTEAQKREFLPRLARGQILAAFCLSEPEVGSDAASVQTHAQLSEDGSHWILSGEKRYATNAAIAGFMTVMAKTQVTDENGRRRDKVTAFIVTPDLPGFEIVKHNRSKMGIRGSWQAVLRFNEMRVPRDRVLGEVGKGLKVALSVLDYGRCTLSAGCVGGAKRALELCVGRASSRRQFGRAIGEFHLIKQKIARMAELTFAMESLTHLTARRVDAHDTDVMLETAICKLFCSESLWQIVDDAVQIWGGEGYMRESDGGPGIERMLRDARINRIVEGTTEVMTAFVALMGMKGVGEDLENVLRLARHPVNNFGRLARFARGQWEDVLVGHSFEGLHPQLKSEGQAVARLTRLLAKSVLRLLGRYRERILEMELIHQRVAWAVVELYAMAAVISRLEGMLQPGGVAAGGNGKGNGHSAAGDHVQRDLLVGKGYCHHAAERIERNLRSLFDAADDRQVIAVADAVMGINPAGDTE
ncbi:acyl-CoA dehydrogenase family protein [Fontivita pretiosa]|uniref:acyl-CoA dehydrogenase family protein n=1 Tax=Fontivita pretiosa TaxID=2989684 RepID=UPI003D181FF5